MKNPTNILLLCILMGCTKNQTQPAETTALKPESCSFGITEFNLSKRPPVNDSVAEILSKGKITVTPPHAVILLDFNGQLVSGTAWNTAGSINCAPANLGTVAQNKIMNRLINDFSPFNVVVTTDENLYAITNANKRMRVIITETWEWFGHTGGTSFIGSFTWGNNTPCFVFSSLLNYNEKLIAEAASHEVGHTLGLKHQSTYIGTHMSSQYNYGAGNGELSWAPIMGCAYSKNLSTWHKGPTPCGSTSLQDDVTIISNILGNSNDDYSNSFTNATQLTSSLSGIINSSTDQDFFSVNLTQSKHLSVIPFNVGAANAGANMDMMIRIYNHQGQLLFTRNDPASLSVTATLNAGQYYICVSTASNAFASNCDMLGKYTISLY